MDNQLPLNDLITLLRAGCEIQLRPEPGPMGYLYAEIVVIPPPTQEPQSANDELQALQHGQPLHVPMHAKGFSLYYNLPQMLEHFFHDVQMLYVRRRPISPRGH